MASNRRLGLESSKTRAQLIEAAEQLAREEGCAAVTARRLADKVGLKREIVHYYFGTIDDLFVAVMRREAESVREHIARVVESDEPLRAIWEMGTNARATYLEFMAMATRRKALQVEAKRYMEELRIVLTRAITRYLELHAIESPIPPVVAALVMMCVSPVLAVEKTLDVSYGHAETKAFVEDWLRVMGQSGRSPTRSKPERSRVKPRGRARPRRAGRKT